MIEAILGSASAERVLIFLTAREEGFATEVARLFQTNLSPIQKQFERMERDGLLINRKVGRTRLYRFNPRYPFVIELKALTEKALAMYPIHLREALLYNRRRPRKKNKPL